MAQSPKEVTVTNFPNPQNVAGSVEVTNLPAVQDVNIVSGGTTPSSPRFQIVGFTTATYNGNLGGFFGATQKCQLEFPASRMCTPLEVQETTSIPGGLTGVGWVDVGCITWTTEDFNLRGSVVSGQTGISTISPFGGRQCNESGPIACCALVP
jgi:hypothetical protein